LNFAVYESDDALKQKNWSKKRHAANASNSVRQTTDATL